VPERSVVRQLEFPTGRPVTLAPRGMVTSPHSLASAAGLDMLRAGGSAVDAAVAASAVLAVVYPHMTGLGGDAFWLIHDGRSGEIRHLNGGGRAAAAADLAWFAGRGIDEIPVRGVVPATLTVPGAVASWIEAQRSYGRLALRRLLEPAIAYAQEGFPVTARFARFIEMMGTELAADRDLAALFLSDGSVPKTGARLANKNLARTLEAVAAEGWAGVYAGEVADEMARFARAAGGLFRS
jgi:gamma-glutamyltranspeptidase